MVDLNTRSLSAVRNLMRHRKAAAAGGESSITDADRIQAKKEAVGHIFGVEVARELLTVNCEEGDLAAVSSASIEALRNGSSSVADPSKIVSPPSPSTTTSSSSSSTAAPCADDFVYKCTGLVTNASYRVKQSSAAFLIFINDRLVECTGLRKALEAVYYDLLPTKGKPFVYLSLELPGLHVDVNVHPTKKEVRCNCFVVRRGIALHFFFPHAGLPPPASQLPPSTDRN